VGTECESWGADEDIRNRGGGSGGNLGEEVRSGGRLRVDHNVHVSCRSTCKRPSVVDIVCLVGDLVLHILLNALLEALTHQLDNLVLPLWHTTCLLLVFAKVPLLFSGHALNARVCCCERVGVN